MLSRVRECMTSLAERSRARLPILIPVLFGVFAPVTLPAQTARPQPDCNLAERRFDNPLGDHTGWSMRRYQWHAFYAVTSTVAAEGIHRVTHAPRWVSAATATVALGLVPHIRGGLLIKRYPVDPLDWSFDIVNRAMPLFVWSGTRSKTWRGRAATATSYVAAYAALACYASP